MTISVKLQEMIIRAENTDVADVITGPTTAVRFSKGDFGAIQVQVWINNRIVDAVYVRSQELSDWLHSPRSGKIVTPSDTGEA